MREDVAGIEGVEQERRRLARLLEVGRAVADVHHERQVVLARYCLDLGNQLLVLVLGHRADQAHLEALEEAGVGLDAAAIAFSLTSSSVM